MIKRALLITASAQTIAVALTSMTYAQSLPTGGTVVAGSASITSTAKSVTINQSSQRAITNWNSFGVGQGYSVTFTQPSDSAAMLNRVTGSAPSTIAGQVRSNGQVYLVNPNGIQITATGTVNTGAFAASTLAITDSDFLSGRPTFTGTGQSAAVVNNGHIVTSGDAVLIGGTVTNSGNIVSKAGRVGLAAGESVSVDLEGDGFLSVAVPSSSADQAKALITQAGRIRTHGNRVDLRAATSADVARFAITMSGTIDTHAVHRARNGAVTFGNAGAVTIAGGPGGKVNVSGRIRTRSKTAKGGDVTISGTSLALTGARIETSGATGAGAITIGGKGTGQQAASVAIDATTSLVADATGAGNGGAVSIWSTGLTTVHGQISARGGPNGGDGGLIETSGQTVDFTGLSVTTTAPLGATGRWLVDPDDLVIDAAAATTIQTALQSSDVMLQTTASTASGAGTVVAGGAGDITVNAGLTWGQHTLTLNAYHDVVVNQPMTVAGSAGLNLTAGNAIAITAPLTLTGSVTLNAGGAITDTAALSAGAFTLTAGAWSQNTATLPSFSATDFTLNGGSFLRASGGSGTPASPYLLTDVYGVQGVGTLLTNSFTLANNIDASSTSGWNSGAGFVPIGYDPNYHYYFGTFDGAGKTISGLTINRPGTNSVGLFGILAGMVENLGLVGGTVTGGGSVGALVGTSYGGKITQTNASTTVHGVNAVGGLVGEADDLYDSTTNTWYNNGAITNSSATGTVTGSNYVGGLVGFTGNGDVTISQTFATGAVSGSQYVGGLVGEANATITQSYATGAVSAGDNAQLVGGLFGRLTFSYTQNNYATGPVSAGKGSSNVGGLVGYLFFYNTIAQSYATGSVTTGSGSTNVSGLVGGINGANSAISQVFAMGAVNSGSGSKNVGGLVGLIDINANNTSISQAYAAGAVTVGPNSQDVGGGVGFINQSNASISQTYVTGAVSVGSGSTKVGGFAGDNLGTISNSYWDTLTTGQATVGIAADHTSGATGLTTAQLQGALPSGFDASAWGTGTGLYPYLKNFYPNGVQAISGIAYSGSGVTPLASNASGAQTVFASVGGATASATTGANGYYYILEPAGTLTSAGTPVLAYTTANNTASGTVTGASLITAKGTAQQLDIWGNTLIAATTATTLTQAPASVSSLLADGNGTQTNSQLLATATGGSAPLAAGAGALTNVGYIATGGGFTLDAAIPSTGLYVQTTSGNITVPMAQTINGTGLTLSAAGALNIAAPITVMGAGAVNLSYDQNTTTASATDLSFGLTASGFTGGLTYLDASGNALTAAPMSGAGSLSINGQSYRLLYSMSDFAGTSYGTGAYALANTLDASLGNGTTYSQSISAFMGGTIEGLGHSVTNLTISAPSTDYVGLFNQSNGTLRDIGVVGETIRGHYDVGGLIGQQAGGSIVNTYTTGSVTAGPNAGGLVGEQASGSITNAFSSASVMGTGIVGGLVGLQASSIANADATGFVQAGGTAGGLVGVQQGSASIVNAYATGALITLPGSRLGGLVGLKLSGSVTNGFYDTQTTGQSSSDGGTGLTTAQLQGTLPSGFDPAVWGTGTGLYPYLKSFFPNGVQAISGIAYKDAGTTPAASSSNGTVTVSLDADGGLISQATTGANGYYYIALPAGTVANGANFLVSTPINASTGARAAATIGASTYSNGTPAQTGVNLYGTLTTAPTSATTLSSAPSFASVQASATSIAGSDTAAAAVVAATSGAGILATGASFTIDQAVNDTSNVFITTIAPGAALNVMSPVTVADRAGLNLTAAGALTLTAPITVKGAGNIVLGYDQTTSTPSTADLSFGLTAAGFTGGLTYVDTNGNALTSGAGGALSINGQSYTLLYSMSDLAGISGSGTYALARSIDASGTTYGGAIVGNLSGTVEGLGHTVNNMIIASSSDYAGLFGQASGTIRDIGVVAGSVTGDSNTAALVGFLNGGTITNAYSTSAVNGFRFSLGGGDWVGGLVGTQMGGSITNAFASGAVAGSFYVGGLVGVLYGGTITNAYAAGAVSGSTSNIGGLVGDQNGGTILNAYAAGAVNGTDTVGGLVGFLWNAGSIMNAYATGAVSGSSNVGGLVAVQNSGTITNGYWDVSTTGRSGTGAGLGLTTAQLQGGNATISGAAWGGGANGLYPYLKSFYPNGVQAISGTAYKDAGTTPAASNANGLVTVSLDAIGGLIGQAATGANGYYYLQLPAGTVANGTNFLVSTPANATTGATAAATVGSSTYSNGTPAQTGVNLYGTLTTAPTSATTLSSAPSLASVQTSATTIAGSDAAAAAVVAATTGVGILATGAGFTIDQAVNDTTNVFIATTTPGAALTVTSPVTVASGAGLNLSAAGALNVTAPITVKGAGNVVLGYDQITSTPSTADLSFGLTAAGFTGGLTYVETNGNALTSGAGGTLSINGQAYTLEYSLHDLAVAANGNLGGTYALATNVDGSNGGTPYSSAVIGSPNHAFSGTFDGLGHTINNLTIASSGNYIGLFGQAWGTIRDIGLVGGTISGSSGGQNTVGGLVGFLNSGTINGSYSTASVSSTGGGAVGGLVGFAAGYGTVTGSFVTGSVQNHGNTGGVIGEAQNSSFTITNVFATGAVTGAYSGGLVGYLYGAKIRNSFATGAVNGSYAAGGLVGNAEVGATIDKSYATGVVNGGGLLGQANGYGQPISVQGYYDTVSTGQTTSVGGTGLTTAQLQGTLPTGFDPAVWGTGTGLYPYLKGFYPNGVQAISGTAYKDTGTTPAASSSNGAVTVSLDANGGLLSQATTGANGTYYIALPAGTIANGTSFVASTTANSTTGSVNSATLAPVQGSGVQSGANLYGNTLTETPSSSTTSLTALNSAFTAAFGAANMPIGFDPTAGGYSIANRTISNRFVPGFSVDAALTQSGTLTLTGTFDASNSAAAVNVGSFIATQASWTQIASTLPAFTAGDFQIQAGSFLRATGGDGSSATPYQIIDVYGLQGVGQGVGNVVSTPAIVLMNDIDASGTAAWNGRAGFNPLNFSGTFDGQGHTITGLTINRPTQDNVGLFATLGGSVSNIGLVGGSVVGRINVGELAGVQAVSSIANAYSTGSVTGALSIGGLVGKQDRNSSITNAYATGTVTGYTTLQYNVSAIGVVGGLVGFASGSLSHVYTTGQVTGDSIAGGLVGQQGGGSITSAYTTGSVSAKSNVGGLVGSTNSGNISTSYATGTVSAPNGVVGGLVGDGADLTISSSYSTANVSGGIAGGLLGVNEATTTITSSYASGPVRSTQQGGGLVGENAILSGPVTSSFWDMQTTGQSTSAGGTGLTTAQMQNPFTFINAGWDFASVWGKSTTSANGGYMLLRPLSTGLYDDYVRLSGATSKTYGDANPSISGITLSGSGAANVSATWGSAITPTTGAGSYLYSVGNVVSVTDRGSRTAYIDYGSDGLTINARVINLSGSKTYDGRGSFDASAFSIASQLVNGDSVTLTGTASVVSKNVAAGAQSLSLGTLALSSTNYTLVGGTDTATISKATISGITGITANGKTYDGTTAATLVTSGAGFTGSVQGDNLTVATASGAFLDKTAGPSKTVTISGLTLGGLDAGNYVLASSTATTSASISPATISAITGITANGKTYDGTTAATLVTSGAGFTGEVQGDSLTVATASGAFLDKTVGPSKTVTISGLTLGGADAGNYTLANATATTTADISKATISGITGITANGKTYDGTTAATLITSGAAFTGEVQGDSLTVATASGAFLDKTAGPSKTVTISGLTLGGLDAGNYVLASPTATTTADISKATISAITGITANGKTYDGTTAATLVRTSAGFTGEVQGDSLTVATASGSFLDKNAGPSKTVTISGLTLGGLDAGNYVLASPTATTSASISPATISGITGITANGKTYDGTTAATLVTSGAGFTGEVQGDSLTVATASGAFLDKTAGPSKTVTISGLTLGGADAGNYTLANPTATTTADISKATISAITGITANGKTYDGTTAATLVTSGAGFTGEVQGDSLTVATASGAFLDKTVGPSKTVTISGLTLGGADAGNYTLANATATTSASISPATISGITGITANGKTYDGTTAATLITSGAGFTGAVQGDSLTVATASGAFLDKTVGPSKTVTISGLTLGGLDAGNYTLANPTATTTADISKATISGITGITANGKIYDGTTAATLVTSGAAFTGEVQGDSLTVATASGAFLDKTASPSKTVTISGLTLGGLDAGNYTLANPTATTTASISKATIAAITGITANGKTYDGTTAATLVTSGAGFTGEVQGDTLTVATATGAFLDKTVGPSKTVTISGLTLGGLDAGNYTLASSTATTSASISPATISGITGITANGKTYDGTTAATLVRTSAGFTGEVQGDSLTVATASGSFLDKTVGPSKTVTISGLTLGGLDAGNYTLANPTATTTADISPIALTIGLNDRFKVYGQPDPVLSYRLINGTLVGGDMLTGTPVRQPGEAVGAYSIEAGTLSAGVNYQIMSIAGVFTIMPFASAAYLPTSQGITFPTVGGSVLDGLYSIDSARSPSNSGPNQPGCLIVGSGSVACDH